MPTNVTALAMPRRAVPTAVAPAAVTARLRRVTGTWSEPEPWTIAVLLVTGVVVIARHPIAQLIGTEPASSPAASVVTSVPAAAPPATAVAAGAALAPAPTHAPVDPFRALVNGSGRILAPAAVAPAAAGVVSHSGAGRQASAPTRGATCAGDTYTVRSGDTLWAIAARSVGSPAGKQVEVRWHRVYAENRGVIGADPSLLPVGVRLCLPAM